MKLPACPHCGKALALVQSERFGPVTVHETPLCAEAQNLKEKGPPTVAISFLFVGLVPPQGRPRCTETALGVQCILPKGHRGAHRGNGDRFPKGVEP